MSLVRRLRGDEWPDNDPPPVWRRVAIVAAHALHPAAGEAAFRREVERRKADREARKRLPSPDDPDSA